ncbi:MAG: uracil phosphoribosyltransferase [Eubacteriales bacterium]|nr:uracil phosphoribosyltransferase [Eubacteriales bacterium]
MGNVYINDHPLIQHKLTIMRKKETGSKDFRELLTEISMLMGYELTRGLPTEQIEIETPTGRCKAGVISGRKLAIVPILRAGLGMVDGLMQLIPAAKIGHIGLYRDEKTLKPVEYFCRLPADVTERLLIVCDPMLATGSSAVEALHMLKKRGCANIRMMCLLGAPEGVRALQEAHPDVDLYIAAVDSHLNENGYIVPGLGDAGDRLFGTL